MHTQAKQHSQQKNVSARMQVAAWLKSNAPADPASLNSDDWLALAEKLITVPAIKKGLIAADEEASMVNDILDKLEHCVGRTMHRLNALSEGVGCWDGEAAKAASQAFKYSSDIVRKEFTGEQ